MKMDDLVKALQASEPSALGKLPEKRVSRVARALLREIGTQIDNAADGEAVAIPGLGTFRSKSVTAKSGDTEKRVLFRRTRGKAAAAD